jgi:hypothetical protein
MTTTARRERSWQKGTTLSFSLSFTKRHHLFLLYVAISLVKVINAARQDKDWATIARTPLVIIIAVTAGDILTTLITG